MSVPIRTRLALPAIRRERLITAAVALLLGIALCFAMYSWQTPWSQPSPGQTKVWLLTVIPFAGLAVLILRGLGRSATAAGLIVLVALTFFAYLAFGGLWFDTSATLPLGLQIFYGVIVLGHLLPFREHHSRAEADAPRTPNATTARRLWLILLGWTVLTSWPCLLPWTSGTSSALAFCVAAVAPLWLSSAFVLFGLARDQASKMAATLWVGATCIGLLVLFFGVLLSHLTLAGD